MSNICKVLVMAMNTVFLHLSEEAIKRLNKLRGWRKVSRSAILREAVDQYLVNQSQTARASAFGIWQGSEEDGVEYQRKLREEW
ncbi:CopG family transcriptional regulator [Escherichia coli]|nr:CopG family transcriptional regulator [Escherichia coli]EME3719634.1 CopG family transcriptional regulator [Escherichia coli]